MLFALERTPKRKIFVILNSAFFLWILTASMLTVGGGYISQHAQCMADANKLIDRRERIKREIGDRKQKSQGDSTAHGDNPTQLHPETFAFAEFSKHSNAELDWELSTVEARFIFPATPAELVDFKRKRSELMEKLDPFPPRPAITAYLNTPEWKRFKTSFDRDNAFVDQIFSTHVYDFQPTCSFYTTLNFALGKRPKLVNANMTQETLETPIKWLGLLNRRADQELRILRTAFPSLPQ
jgi:hypothetical protein